MAANNDVKENEITQASAQATLANLKEIRVVTTDGSSKAYGKADFMAVIAAGIKSYFSSIAAGNIAGILTADSGKAGISALADVAQVLGGAYTNILRQTNVNSTFKITKIASAAGILVVNMGMSLPAVFLFGFLDGDISNVFVKQIYKSSNSNNIYFTKDNSGNLYFTSQYGNSRGHCIVSISGLKFNAEQSSTEGSENVHIEV